MATDVMVYKWSSIRLASANMLRNSSCSHGKLAAIKPRPTFAEPNLFVRSIAS